MTPWAGSLAELVRAVDPTAELLGAENLAGGVSALIQALDVRTATGEARWVLRTLPDDQDLDAATEYRLLCWLEAQGFPVAPAIRAIPATATRPAGAILMHHVPGRVIEQPTAAQIDRQAALLAALHRLPPAGLDFLPAVRSGPMPTHWPGLDPARIAALVAVADSHAPATRPPFVLCHGDYWCGNLLWQDDGANDAGRITVLDWEEAGIGDRAHDLAVARLEMAWQTSFDQMDALTQAYLRASAADGVDGSEMAARLPAHDLAVTLRRLCWLTRWALPEPVRDWCLAVGLEHAERAAAHLRDRANADASRP